MAFLSVRAIFMTFSTMAMKAGSIRNVTPGFFSAHFRRKDELAIQEVIYQGVSHMIKRCKLAILKTTIQKDLAEEYGVARILICSLMNVGDVFYADYAKTEGFCDEEFKQGELKK